MSRSFFGLVFFILAALGSFRSYIDTLENFKLTNAFSLHLKQFNEINPIQALWPRRSLRRTKKAHRRPSVSHVSYTFEAWQLSAFSLKLSKLRNQISFRDSRTAAQRLPAPGTPVQFDCLPGTFSAGDACAPCPEGTFWQSKDTCVPCSPGTYTALDRSFKCIPCSGNTIAVDAGSIICTPCPKGFYTYDGIKCVFPSPSRTPTRKVVTTAPSKKKCSSVKNPAKPPVKCPSKP